MHDGAEELVACDLVACGFAHGLIGSANHLTHLQATTGKGQSAQVAPVVAATLVIDLWCTAKFACHKYRRTPKINKRTGRDHYPRAMFCLMAGGGMKGGQVIGASDAKGEGPKDRTISPDDVAASFMHSLGIDHTKEYHTPSGRPVMIVRDGTVIPELFS